jgi:UPF0755 protein
MPGNELGTTMTDDERRRRVRRDTELDDRSGSTLTADDEMPESGQGPDDGEWVALPSGSRGGRRVLAILALGVLTLAFAIGMLLFWAARKIDPPGEPGAIVESLEIPAGSSSDAISAQLAEEGIISDSRLFSAYVGMKSAGPWEAGRYTEFRKDMSFDEAIAALDEGPLPVGATTVRVTEGKRLSDALVQIADQHPGVTTEDLVAALGSGEVTSKYLPAGSTNFEGMIFPDTYEFRDDATAVQILQTMADEMSDTLDELGYERAETLQGRTPYELVTTASLAEREAGQPPEERGKIARVIFNRLDEGEPLGIDAALLYGLGRTGGELTKSDLATDTPYNTRLHPGLPPTPIGLPSRASLEGAINPPDGDWKYYVLVSNDPPTHLFTASYSEFQRAKADAQERGVF